MLLEGGKFYLGRVWAARGLTVVFVLQMLAGKWAVVWISMWAQEETVEGLGVSQCTADSLGFCVRVYIFQPSGISRHIFKQTSIVRLFMYAHPCLRADLIPSVHICMSRPLSRPQCWALGAESVHYCHGRCILQSVPWLSLWAHRDAFSCGQRHFAWLAWAMVSIRTDGTIWREIGKEEGEGARVGEVEGRITEKRSYTCKERVIVSRDG